jgi:hypothetical protein
MAFENKTEELLPLRPFLARLGRSFVASLGVLAFSLGIGSVGYHYLGDLPWVDAVHNSSMILTGMGPVDRMQTTGGKLFASAYALYSGIAFLTMMAIMLAPVAHRLLHKFHLDDDDDDMPGTVSSERSLPSGKDSASRK